MNCLTSALLQVILHDFLYEKICAIEVVIFQLKIELRTSGSGDVLRRLLCFFSLSFFGLLRHSL